MCFSKFSFINQNILGHMGEKLEQILYNLAKYKDIL